MKTRKPKAPVYESFFVDKTCDHLTAILGLDAAYCPRCKSTLVAGTPAYKSIFDQVA